jgi:hypothetical protein
MTRPRTTSLRRRLVAAAATIGALAVATPVAGAGAATGPGIGGPSTSEAGVSTSDCSTSSSSVGGPTAGTTSTTCGAAVVSDGPAIGQVSNVEGPTIAGSTVVAPVSVSSGAAVVTGR